jgi:uncharacterized membrane protein YozB (DUF420 family)
VLQWALFSLAGVALFLAAGSVIIHDWRHIWGGHSRKHMNMMISAGIIGLINAAIYLIDFSLTVACGRSS